MRLTTSTFDVLKHRRPAECLSNAVGTVRGRGRRRRDSNVVVHVGEHGATQRLGAAEGRIGKVEAAAKENGISLRTLRRAREGLRVVVRKAAMKAAGSGGCPGNQEGQLGQVPPAFIYLAIFKGGH